MLTDNENDIKDLTFGTKVRVGNSRRTGEVISGPNRKGFYQIAVGSMIVNAARADLNPVPIKKRKSRRAVPEVQNRDSDKCLCIDLHGCTRETALGLVEQLIDRALTANTSALRIVHGIGTGAIKDVVHGYLGRSKHVSRFVLDPGNRGITLVYL